MDKTKIHKAIKLVHEGKTTGVLNEQVEALVNALEEIASPANSMALRDAISLLSRNLTSTIHSRDCAEKLSKISALIESIQVPKEDVYAFPETMQRHFEHYYDKFIGGPIANKDDPSVSYAGSVGDGFGCMWRMFVCPNAKELVDYLRKNNVPIKVIE